MDDNLELPTSISKQDAAIAQEEEEEQSSGDEDQGPDWTKITGLANARPVIPKRGEKDFEPTAHGGSGLQRHVLDRSRSAMLEALKATRTISNKSVSHAIWYPQLKRAHVTVARGIHFTTTGHSVARTSAELEDVKKARRLELLPEEALYLIERGAMYCWSPTHVPLPEAVLLDNLEGVPMSVQQAYAEMIGTEDLTLEKYQVYAYLKRLGYVVTRARSPSADYPLPPPFPSSAQSSASILGLLFRAASSFLSKLLSTFVEGRNWWRPIRFGRWLHHDMNYASLFHSLRFLPAGYDVPLHTQQAQATRDSPYQIFYNLYKPSTPFKKTSPPLPDFQVVIVKYECPVYRVTNAGR
ncbi:hypothetical protein GSI_15354 [Ganoderma sinense ZZ0214-1]|uniref:tRNA-splicing endonuclease subunit Sen54 N-terminal domain-containing protein n=1 Tax=Ganoderma sinense ZZ0214-1 TaxID=1077348 RepID=A0A2G8RMC6_9APHY|nr:hypothetical protein GSI_15354 [Ganoderma sinense ZZ0214-1]